MSQAQYQALLTQARGNQGGTASSFGNLGSLVTSIGPDGAPIIGPPPSIVSPNQTPAGSHAGDAPMPSSRVNFGSGQGIFQPGLPMSFHSAVTPGLPMSFHSAVTPGAANTGLPSDSGNVMPQGIFSADPSVASASDAHPFTPFQGNAAAYGFGPEHLFFPGSRSFPTGSDTPAATGLNPAVFPAPPNAANASGLSSVVFPGAEQGFTQPGAQPGAQNAARPAAIPDFASLVTGRTFPQAAAGGRVQGFADGGIARGLVASATPGRADHVNTHVPADSYIVPADVVSAYGQGNTLAGAHKLEQQFPSRPHDARGGMVPVKLSGGEFTVHPHYVRGLGKGSAAAGAAILDERIKSVRATLAKKLKKLPPPKK